VKPVICQLADEIRYEWPEARILLIFERLHETDSGAVRGMLTVESTERRNGTFGHIYWAAVSITTATDRKTLTQKLDKAAPVQGGWEQDVDRCFLDVYRRHTAVAEPVQLTGVEEDDLDTEYLVDPILPLGQVTLLLADQGSTKSYLMLYLAACIVLGCDTVFGAPARRIGPAIYFDWEVDAQVANKRLAWICRGLGSDVPRGLHYVNMSTRGRLFDRIRDMRHIIDRLQPVLVVVDSLTFATGADLNSAEYAAPTMSAIGSLGDGVTKLVSAHPNKASRNASAEEISVIGSTLFEYRARSIWHMKREQARAPRFGVSMTPRKPFDGPPLKPLAYLMNFDNVNHAARFQSAKLGDLPNLERSTLPVSGQIRRALARSSSGLDTNQLAELLGQKVEVIKMECNRMSDVFPMILGGGRGKATVWALRAETES
jgi:hypothetical protein